MRTLELIIKSARRRSGSSRLQPLQFFFKLEPELRSLVIGQPLGHFGERWSGRGTAGRGPRAGPRPTWLPIKSGAAAPSPCPGRAGRRAFGRGRKGPAGRRRGLWSGVSAGRMVGGSPKYRFGAYHTPNPISSRHGTGGLCVRKRLAVGFVDLGHAADGEGEDIGNGADVVDSSRLRVRPLRDFRYLSIT